MNIEFLSQLDVRKMAGPFWQVLAVFSAMCGGQLVTVPAGYVSDFASVPRLPLVFWAFGAVGEKAATLHDWLYSRAQYPRAWCDEVFLAALEAEGVGWWKRQAMYRAVRLFGASRYGSARA